jgi:uncharacterized membrane protein
VEIKIFSGSHKGEITSGTNRFIGKMEFDKVFASGRHRRGLLEYDKSGSIIYANMVEHYRAGLEIMLLGMFAVLIIVSPASPAFAPAFFCFCSDCAYGKILIPFMLKGISPIVAALLVGKHYNNSDPFNGGGVHQEKPTPPSWARFTCSLATCLLAVVLGGVFNINGAVMQWSESLLYAGFENLDLTLIFQAGIYLACSGAVLDLAIDISAALDEVIKINPGYTKRTGAVGADDRQVRSWEARRPLSCWLYGQLYIGHDGVHGFKAPP